MLHLGHLIRLEGSKGFIRLLRRPGAELVSFGGVQDEEDEAEQETEYDIQTMCSADWRLMRPDVT